MGAGRTYTTPSQISTLVGNGDTVEIDAGIYLADVAHWTANNLVLKGVGNGYARLHANNVSFGSKAIWVISGNNTKVENVEFAYCHDVAGADQNWAGIRQEGIGLTVTHCYFHENDDGILAGDNVTSDIVIEYSEFDRNGYGDGYSHNLYINHVNSLTFRYNYTHQAIVGHELKSRAYNNYILYNRISDEATSDASRNIDLPNGGYSLIIGNIIEQGPNSQNSNMIGYGLEGLTNPAIHEFYLINNTLINNKASGTFVDIENGTALFKSYNNVFAGVGNSLNGMPVSTDTAGNMHEANIAAVGFVNASAYDYHLISSSSAIGFGVNPGYAGTDTLVPAFEYLHPSDRTARLHYGSIDAGAFEYTEPMSVTNHENKNATSFYIYNDFRTTTFVFNNDNGKALTIYDSMGKRVNYRTNFKGKVISFDFSNLKNGIYIAQVEEDDLQIISRKFILSH